jgi:hypothetical protein
MLVSAAAPPRSQATGDGKEDVPQEAWPGEYGRGIRNEILA